jgi:N-acetylglutamate synthase-like GNAT family acetyltransferase
VAVSGGVEVRGAEGDDAAAVARLLGELGYPSAPERVAVRLARLVDDPRSRVLVAERSGEVAGVAAWHAMPSLAHDEPACRLFALVVGERWRRSGIATALVRQVEQQAARAGCRHVELTTRDERYDAHAFYERLGYERTSQKFTKPL